ncbi:hypothetical protein ANCDUO_03244, partial [Ancylostoma duodenale]
STRQEISRSVFESIVCGTTQYFPVCCPLLSQTTLPRRAPSSTAFQQCSILRRVSSNCPVDGFVFCDAAPETNVSLTGSPSCGYSNYCIILSLLPPFLANNDANRVLQLYRECGAHNSTHWDHADSSSTWREQCVCSFGLSMSFRCSASTDCGG